VVLVDCAAPKLLAGRRADLDRAPFAIILDMVGAARAVVGEGLLEREHELAVLDELTQRVRAGGSAVALVEGPPGIGKSQLLSAAQAGAREAGLRVLAARGSELERGLGFGVVRQLFEPVLGEPDGRDRWLSDSALAAARVFDPAGVGTPFGDVGFSVLYGLSWLTANIAGDGPMLLAIDDLQWCDRASLRFLAYLSGRLESLGVLVVATIRRGEPDVDLRLLGEIERNASVVSIRPRELSQLAVSELVRQRLGADGAPSFIAACHGATGGNPLLVLEVLKTMRTEGVRPDAEHVGVVRDIGGRAVSPAVLLRLARLPADAVAVARAVAVLGDGAELPATAALAGLDEDRVAKATRSLVGAEILSAEAPLGFVHPLVRDAVNLELAPAERALAHERAGRVLVALGAAPERVAAHLLLVPCRSDRSVVSVLSEAARAAASRGDPEIAMAYLRRALAEPPDPEQAAPLLVQLGIAEALSDEKVAAAEHLRAGLEGVTDPEERAAIAEVLAQVVLFSAPAAQAAAVARAGFEELPDDLADVRFRLEALELFTVSVGARIPDAAARLQACRGGLRGDGPGARMLAAVVAADWAQRGGSAAECCQLALAALADGVLIAADPALMPGVAGIVLEFADRDEVLAVLEARIAEAHRRGSLMALGSVRIGQAAAWLARGELSEAESALERANLATGPTGIAPAHSVAGTAYLAEVLIERGQLVRARELLDAHPSSAPGSDTHSLYRRTEVRLLLAERRWTDALQAADEYAETLRDGIVNPAWAPWRSLRALALAGLDRVPEGIALLEDELALARSWGAPRALGRAHRLVGTFGRAQDVTALREAVEITEGSPARLEHAKSLVALGSALRLDRKRSQAREPLRQGLDLAVRCGATPLAEHARTELYAAGGRPKRDSLTGPESLTPSERRVAELAADGQGNREIAQALYVTPRTVEFHLTSVYRKLGISARGGLAEILSDSSPA
jgi:DNA-binding CsgD family transcriptional regulator